MTSNVQNWNISGVNEANFMDWKVGPQNVSEKELPDPIFDLMHLILFTTL